MNRSPYFVLFKCLLLGLGCLAALELLLRIPQVQRFIPLPSPYYTQSVMARERTLNQYKIRFGNPEWVTMGSSIARANVNIGKLQAAAGARCFGLGLSSMSPGRAEIYWDRFWSKRVSSPKLVLHFVRVNDLTEHYDYGKDEVLEKGRIERSWRHAPSGQPTMEEKLLSFKTAQYYGAVSKAIAGDRHPFFGDPFVTDIYGCKSEPGSLADMSRDEARRKHQEPLIGPCRESMSNSNSMEIFRRMNAKLGGRYVVVFCPEFIDAWQSGLVLQEWHHALALKFREANIAFVDPTAKASSFVEQPENYIDFIHYSQKGAEEFTNLLVTALREAGISH